MVIGPDGQPVAVPAEPQAADDADDEAASKNVTDLVEQPAKVMRIGRMVQQLLEEVKAAPVDEAGRKRLARCCTPPSRSSRTASRPSSTTSSTG